jgi:protein-L-isoaspartate(D-aspartate) O-methyltransferase
MDENYIEKRNKMVDEQIIARGIQDKKVIDAMRLVPRHIFVKKKDIKKAYEDHPLSIGENQTISQPYMVALMTECLELANTDKVLEIGTGSGYQTSILAKLSSEVYTIDRFMVLSKNAEKLLKEIGITNVHYKVGDGTKGWNECSPFDKIIVTAGAPYVSGVLFEQLKENGILLAPIGNKMSQMLTVHKKIKGKIEIKEISGCMFVPLIGEFGWKS